MVLLPRRWSWVEEPHIDLAACQTVLADAPVGVAAPSFDDALATAARNTWDGVSVPATDDPNYPGGKYRTLQNDPAGNAHPGCTVTGLSYDPAVIANFTCAAKEYSFPEGVEEDTEKPIVLLIHGNSDSPASWEGFLHPDPDPETLGFPVDTTMREQLADLLPAAGFRTIAIDNRTTTVFLDEPTSNLVTENAAGNVDHGWAVPLAQELIKRVVDANPGRQVSLIGFSLGATVMRDAVRRLFIEFRNGEWDINIFERIQDMVVASGAQHGVNAGDALCGGNTTMRGTVGCEMGQRNTYTQTAFHESLNGPAMPDDGDGIGYWYESPCADGSYAFGLVDACGDNQVEYTTITMADLEDGTQQDLFVSEYSSRLHPAACVNNVVSELNDFDTSGYFLNGLFRNHYGSLGRKRMVLRESPLPLLLSFVESTPCAVRVIKVQDGLEVSLHLGQPAEFTRPETVDVPDALWSRMSELSARADELGLPGGARLMGLE